MAVSRENSELVERYLLDQLSEEEKTVFQAQLLRDPDLQEELRQIRYLQKAMRAEKLQSEKRGRPGRRWLFLGISFFMLLLTGILWLYFSKTNAVSSNTFSPAKSSPQNPQPSQKVPPVTTPSEKQTAPKTTLKESKPVASDFVPNPDLENFIGNTVRSGAFQLNITQPLPNSQLHRNRGQVEFKLEGTIEGKPVEENWPLQIHLFSNKKEDYQNFKSIWTAPVFLNSDGDPRSFSITKSLPLTPGLYYFILENSDSGEMLYVGRFINKD